MKYIWVITDTEDGNVIIAASSEENATKQLFDYMGYVDIDTDEVKYLGFNRYKYSEFEDDYIGYYSFNIKYSNMEDSETSKYNLYCKYIDANQK